jgi:glycosyltransferase involved in cell wall biosynthesis
MTMKKVLVIASRFPWPPFSGDRLRTTIWLDALAEEAEVALVAPEGEVPASAPRFEFFPAARSFANGAGGVVRVLRDALPLQTLLAAPYRWSDAIARAQSEAGPFDATIVVLSRLDPWIRPLLGNAAVPAAGQAASRRRGADTAPVQPARTPAFRVLDAIDSLHRNTVERALQAKAPLRWFWRGEARRLARAEAEAADAYDRLIFVSEEDGLAVSNGVVINALADKPRRFDFGFWGRLAYFANEDAASYLLDEIWPLIRERRPAATLAIGGAHVTNSVRRKANRPGVTLFSPVDHIPELARDIRVALLPLRYGSGESTKTMEAAEAGCAIVGMPKAFRGVSALAAHAYVVSGIASGANEFADAAVALLDNHAERARMATALRAAVAASHARETTLARLAAIAIREEAA